MISVQVNGDNMQLEPGSTVASLIEQMQLTGKRLAVEVNGEIVPRSEHPTHPLSENDKIEIVHAIGGG